MSLWRGKDYWHCLCYWWMPVMNVHIIYFILCVSITNLDALQGYISYRQLDLLYGIWPCCSHLWWEQILVVGCYLDYSFVCLHVIFMLKRECGWKQHDVAKRNMFALHESRSKHSFIMSWILNEFWFSNCLFVLAYTRWPSFFSSWVLNNAGWGCDSPSVAAVCYGAGTDKPFECIWLSSLHWAEDALFSFAPLVRFHGIRTLHSFLASCSSLSISDDNIVGLSLSLCSFGTKVLLSLSHLQLDVVVGDLLSPGAFENFILSPGGTCFFLFFFLPQLASAESKCAKLALLLEEVIVLWITLLCLRNSKACFCILCVYKVHFYVNNYYFLAPEIKYIL